MAIGRAVVRRLQGGTGRIAAIGAVALIALAGCAAMPGQEADPAYREVNDPLEPLNRYVFNVNDGLDKLLVRPVADIYRGAVPDFARDGVRNVLRNLRKPLIFINDVLQGETGRAGDTAGSFVLNSTVGVLGFFDVASGNDSVSGFDMPYHGEDFGQTLAVWGIDEGFYLVLPVLGPAPPRDAVGMAVDSVIDPVQYAFHPDDRLLVGAIRFGMTGLDKRSRHIETLDEIERTSIDYYAQIRSLYRQTRKSAIANGREAELGDLPDIDMSLDDADDAPPAPAATAEARERTSARSQ